MPTIGFIPAWTYREKRIIENQTILYGGGNPGYLLSTGTEYRRWEAIISIE